MNTLSNTDSLLSTVEVFDGDKPLGIASLDGNTWRLTTSVPLALGKHTLTAKVNTVVSASWIVNVVSADAGLNLIHPTVEHSRPEGSNKARLNYYDRKADIRIIIPDYNMRTGDTVKVYWVGRDITLGTEIQTVGQPPARMTFTLSKYEVIDVIGGNATMWYTVKRPPSQTTHTSAPLTLIVDGHAYVIDAPTINTGHNNLRVYRQSQFNSQSTAEMRCIGGDKDSDVWTSGTQTFANDQQLNFPIDPAWRARNAGKPVKFNWSVRERPGDGNHYKFSQLLRVNRL